ncbi:hypothetical protein [Kozakia baliensis]|uniref:hypothetical protein n=1 Tax=Kozakia baliensis TaxID=153496 RepID=UPI00087D64C4|nr:hypothetical protein [Kozakia baliensis]AOX21476.1 hypothetical protein A0U90_13285 [Kozakia baliensis]
MAKTYSGQAGANQATNVRLGFLGILELANRPGLPPQSQTVSGTWTIFREGSTLARHIIMFGVSGMLKTPSSL